MIPVKQVNLEIIQMYRHFIDVETWSLKQDLLRSSGCGTQTILSATQIKLR